MSENSIKFSLSNSEQRDSWLNSGHRTLDADTKLPKPAKVYPLSLAERNSLDTWIDEELRKGYIRPSTSPIAAPFFFVKKHDDGSLRPIMDYRALNAITVKNRYPIPRIADLIESLSKASIFTKIDLR